MEELALSSGDSVLVENDNGRVAGIVEASSDVEPHTIAFAFGGGNEGTADPFASRVRTCRP